MFSSEIKSVHFTGIGGTAMAAAAAAMQDKGFEVTGSDQNVYPPMSDLPRRQKNRGDERLRGTQPGAQARPRRHRQRDFPRQSGSGVRARSQAALLLAAGTARRNSSSAANARSSSAGTHGKTTTTSLLTWVFEHNGLNPSYLIGGIPNNFSQGARFTDSEWFIIEGDEYDTAFFDKRSKFIHYQPEIAIVNNLEFDHADIFENLDAVKKTFSHFIRLVPRNGLLLGNGDDANLAPLLNVTHCPVKRFGLGEGNAVQAFNLRFGPTATEFEIPSFKFHLNLVGELNVRNALAVIGAAKHCGLKNKQIQTAFDTFKGIKRRMEVKGIAGGVTVIDDFGHHPTAIRETLRALRIKYAREKIWAVFEPRSNTTRRNVFQHELAESFGRGRRRGRGRGGAAGTIGARGTAEPGKVDAAHRRRRQANGLFAGRGRHREARCAARALAATWGGGGFQQRRFWRDSRQIAGPTQPPRLNHQY